MIVHPGHPVSPGYSQAGNPTFAKARLDWTRAWQPAPLRGIVAAVSKRLQSSPTAPRRAAGTAAVSAGASESSCWVANFNNGNCNNQHVDNNNYVRLVR